MRTCWCENEIFTIYKFGEKTSTIYIFNSIIQLDNYFILKHCQNGQFRNKILVPNEYFSVKKCLNVSIKGIKDSTPTFWKGEWNKGSSYFYACQSILDMMG